MTNKISTHIIFILLLSFSSNCQIYNSIASNDDWALQLESPLKDSLDKWCTSQINEIIRKQKDSTNVCDLYYLNGELYTGWSCEIIPNNPHKYRYEQFENGKMIRRIGYYDNGQIDADFRMRECKNFGPSRMWLYDGRMYIDEFYTLHGVKHGMQKQWYDNGTLAREALYENDKLIFEKKYDRNGNLLKN